MSKAMIPASVVPAYPYEGALYWFIGEVTTRHGRDHEYYQVLYGSDADRFATRAASLCALFDRIELAPADHPFPDARETEVANGYEHPELRLAVSWAHNEGSPENLSVARAVIVGGELDGLLTDSSLSLETGWQREYFLCRAVLQIRLAAQSNAVLLGDATFQRVYHVVAPWITTLLGESLPMAPRALTLDEQIIQMTALDFSPTNFDAFRAIRASTAISDYSRRFRDAAFTPERSTVTTSTFVKLMTEAMDHEDIARHAERGFEATGAVMNVAGLVPVIGTAASAVGMATTAGALAARRRKADHEWYLIGIRMREIELRDRLSRAKV